MKNVIPKNIAVIINKEEGSIQPSETFLNSHIYQLPEPTIPIVGIPGHRILIDTKKKKAIPSRSIFPLGFRWLMRKAKLSTIEKQDRQAVSQFLQQQKIDVVLAEYGPTAVSVMAACKDASVPLIVHFHGYDAYTDEILLEFKDQYIDLFNIASAIIAVSEHMKQQLLSIGAPENKIFVNSCGASTPKNLTATPSSSNINFLMVGRLVEKKAPFISIQAFSKVAKKFPYAKLDIIGHGPLLNLCHQTVSDLGIENQVTFHGAQSHEKVFELMKNARGFLQHSVRSPNNDHEGTPVAILEAMAMGLPVIATRHGGIPDVIEDGVTGSLIYEHNVESMAQAMLALAEDANYAQHIGEKARSSALANYTSELSNERLWNIIKMTC